MAIVLMVKLRHQCDYFLLAIVSSRIGCVVIYDIDLQIFVGAGELIKYFFVAGCHAFSPVLEH